jgi:hypothetical protein
LWLMSLLPKGESMGTKLVELLLIGWLKKKYDNIYLREGAYIESVRWSLI